MSLKVGELHALLKLDDAEFQRGLQGAEQKTGSLGGKLKGLAATGVLAAGALGAAFVGLSIKTFADFDNKLTQSLAIMGDVSDAMRKDMSDAAREVALTTTFSASQAAEAYFFLASAGLDAAASIEALPVVAKFAQAGMFDLARATDLLTDAQSALGLTIRDDAVANMENMIRVSDVLVAANTVANASVEQFAEALTNRAGAALRIVNKDVEEGVAVLAAFADQGVKGAEAGTRLDIVLRDLQRSALRNRETFDRFGIAVFDSQDNLRNLADIVGDMEGALDGMSDAQLRSTLMMLGFQDRSVAAILSLLGMSDAMRQYESTARNAAGITEEIAEKQLQSFSAQLSLLRSRVEDVALELGTALAPTLRDIVRLAAAGAEALGIFVGVVARLLEVTRQAAPAIGAFGAVMLGSMLVPHAIAAAAAIRTLGIVMADATLRTMALGAATRTTTASLAALRLNPTILGLSILAGGLAFVASRFLSSSSNADSFNRALLAVDSSVGVLSRQLENEMGLERPAAQVGALTVQFLELQDAIPLAEKAVQAATREFGSFSSEALTANFELEQLDEQFAHVEKTLKEQLSGMTYQQIAEVLAAIGLEAHVIKNVMPDAYAAIEDAGGVEAAQSVLKDAAERLTDIFDAGNDVISMYQDLERAIQGFIVPTSREELELQRENKDLQAEISGIKADAAREARDLTQTEKDRIGVLEEQVGWNKDIMASYRDTAIAAADMFDVLGDGIPTFDEVKQMAEDNATAFGDAELQMGLWKDMAEVARDEGDRLAELGLWPAAEGAWATADAFDRLAGRAANSMDPLGDVRLLLRRVGDTGKDVDDKSAGWFNRLRDRARELADRHAPDLEERLDALNRKDVRIDIEHNFGDTITKARELIGTLSSVSAPQITPIPIPAPTPPPPQTSSSGFRPWGRATGGPVRRGVPYIVGELGMPELFIPSGAGTIMPLSSHFQPQPNSTGGQEVHHHQHNYYGTEISTSGSVAEVVAEQAEIAYQRSVG